MSCPKTPRKKRSRPSPGEPWSAATASPEDVAHAILALIENGFITGVVLPCDGGLRLT